MTTSRVPAPSTPVVGPDPRGTVTVQDDASQTLSKENPMTPTTLPPSGAVELSAQAHEPDPLYLRVLRATIVGELAYADAWTEAEFVEVGDLVAELAGVDPSVGTTRLAFEWARHRPTRDSVASPEAQEILWELLCASASLPPTIFHRGDLTSLAGGMKGGLTVGPDSTRRQIG